MNKITKSLIINVSALTAYFSYQAIATRQHERTGGFALSKISSSLPFNPEWVTPPLELSEQRELAHALSQEYSYLEASGPCFSFVSADGHYVIKFLKNLRIKAPLYTNLPLPSSLKQKAHKEALENFDRLKESLSSYKIAAEELKKETGLIFAHLNKTKTLRQTLSLKDKAGRKFLIDLDEKEFVVQKKADPLCLRIEYLMAKGEKEKAEALLKNLLSLIVRRSEMGIFDEDAHAEQSFGCVEEEVIMTEAGRLRKDPTIKNPQKYIDTMYKVTEKLTSWLAENYPELKTSFEEEIHALEKTYP